MVFQRTKSLKTSYHFFYHLFDFKTRVFFDIKNMKKEKSTPFLIFEPQKKSKA